MTARTRAQVAQSETDAAAEAHDEAVRSPEGVDRKAAAIGDLDGEDPPGKTNENV